MYTDAILLNQGNRITAVINTDHKVNPHVYNEAAIHAQASRNKPKKILSCQTYTPFLTFEKKNNL